MPQPSARLPLPTARLQHALLSILPRVRAHGLVAFRDYQPERREEAIAEMVALARHWFVRLAQRGKDATQFPISSGRLRRLCRPRRAPPLRPGPGQGRAVAPGPTAASVRRRLAA